MDVREYAKNSRLPLKALYALVDAKAINPVLSPDDLHFLASYEKVWGSEKIMKIQLAQKSKARRAALIETAEMSQWESYCFSRLKAGYSDNNPVTTRELLEEVKHYYGTAPKPETTLKIKRLRDKARYFWKKQSAPQGDGDCK